jgi:hypothetical protein
MGENPEVSRMIQAALGQAGGEGARDGAAGGDVLVALSPGRGSQNPRWKTRSTWPRQWVPLPRHRATRTSPWPAPSGAAFGQPTVGYLPSAISAALRFAPLDSGLRRPALLLRSAERTLRVSLARERFRSAPFRFHGPLVCAARPRTFDGLRGPRRPTGGPPVLPRACRSAVALPTRDRSALPPASTARRGHL